RDGHVTGVQTCALPISHVNEDHFLPEVVDPESGEPLPEGEEGVLVFTTLTKEALPLIRYWTGDITSLDSEPCSCGRTLVRMGLRSEERRVGEACGAGGW